MNDRELEIELDVDAAPEAVWYALTDAEGLLGWFASDARTELRPDGDWELASGEYRMTSRVDEIEAPKRLRVVAPPREGFAVATEFVVEARGGGTVVRIVESGFGPAESWDDEIRSRESGWTRYLENLRHYVENHAGEVAAADYLYATFSGAAASAYDALATLLRAELEVSALEEHPPRTVAARVPELGDGRVLGSIESTGEDGMIWLQLIAYGDGREQLEAVRDRIRDRLTAAFPPAGAG